MATSKGRLLLKSCIALLDEFQASKASFRIIASVNQSPNSHTEQEFPRTLFILDSSYNPPSKAHESLAVSAAHAAASQTALTENTSKSETGTRNNTQNDNLKYPGPSRLLLLFSTANADKAAKPAAFEHRLAMMVLLAEELSNRLSMEWSTKQIDVDASISPPGIDIGLTTEPIYHAKSSAISAVANSPSPTYHPLSEDAMVTPNGHTPVKPNLYAQAQHIHLVGYDTITRVFNAKYYTEHDPPLSALDEYFNSHGFRATVRPEGGPGEEEELQAQLRWCEENLANGRLESKGGRPEWASRVEMARAHDEDVGEVSSTRIREAAIQNDEPALNELCSPKVARWIRDFGLYAEKG